MVDSSTGELDYLDFCLNGHSQLHFRDSIYIEAFNRNLI